MNLTIGITTFEHRFFNYFKPLLEQIKKTEPNIEVIVAINGEHKQDFNQEYRQNILEYCSQYDNVYPILFPKFRGLSKLWNTVIIHSSNDYILLLNDDITITDDNFIKIIYEKIIEQQGSFKINSSWSHVVIKKEEISNCGYFDERLLGIGEEDGDFEWRYQYVYKKQFSNMFIAGIVNHVDMSHNPTNIETVKEGKYSMFNKNLMDNTIYKLDDKGLQYGVYPHKVLPNDMIKTQYPYENFYKENINKL